MLLHLSVLDVCENAVYFGLIVRLVLDAVLLTRSPVCLRAMSTLPVLLRLDASQIVAMPSEKPSALR